MEIQRRRILRLVQSILLMQLATVLILILLMSLPLMEMNNLSFLDCRSTEIQCLMPALLICMLILMLFADQILSLGFSEVNKLALTAVGEAPFPGTDSTKKGCSIW